MRAPLAQTGLAAGTDLLVCYDPALLRVTVETIPLEDASLRESWGPQLRRVLLRASRPQSQGVWKLVIMPWERFQASR